MASSLIKWSLAGVAGLVGVALTFRHQRKRRAERERAAQESQLDKQIAQWSERKDIVLGSKFRAKWSQLVALRDDFIVVADFDKTLTRHKSSTGERGFTAYGVVRAGAASWCLQRACSPHACWWLTD